MRYNREGMSPNLPRHIAVIPDGNRRWAAAKKLPPWEGHRAGYERAIEIGKKSRELGIRVFTFWGFSTENWKRPKAEITFLMRAFLELTKRFRGEAFKEEIRVVHLGRKDRLPKDVLSSLTALEEDTRKFKKYYLALALDYGGRDELMRAVGTMIEKRADPQKGLNDFLDTKELPFPDPDLIIRTSGEQRLSGLMPWQGVYAELMFVKKHFPDFSGKDLEKCVEEYARRIRRFGR